MSCSDKEVRALPKSTLVYLFLWQLLRDAMFEVGVLVLQSSQRVEFE
jgi:hypothetical protein